MIEGCGELMETRCTDIIAFREISKWEEERGCFKEARLCVLCRKEKNQARIDKERKKES